jgi:hypothetical protein
MMDILGLGAGGYRKPGRTTQPGHNKSRAVSFEVYGQRLAATEARRVQRIRRTLTVMWLHREWAKWSVEVEVPCTPGDDHVLG